MKTKIKSRLLVAALVWTLGILPIATLGQTTRIVAPKNKYKLSDDIKLGNQAAAEAERQFPVLNDQITTDYVASVGERLVAAIPAEFQHPEVQGRRRKRYQCLRAAGRTDVREPRHDPGGT